MLIPMITTLQDDLCNWLHSSCQGLQLKLQVLILLVEVLYRLHAKKKVTLTINTKLTLEFIFGDKHLEFFLELLAANLLLVAYVGPVGDPSFQLGVLILQMCNK